MKGVIVTLTLFVILFGMNGCYTIVEYSNDGTDQIVYIETPPVIYEEIIIIDPDPPYIGGPHPHPPIKPDIVPVEPVTKERTEPYRDNSNLRNNNGRGNDNSRGNDTRNSSTERNRNGR
jgi:hypothetical protein